MKIPLDKRSKKPLYKQICDYIALQIHSGRLMAHTRLPASRKLSESLGLSRITITNAYEELESQGLVYTRKGSGIYVMYRLDDFRRSDSVDSSAYPNRQHELMRNDIKKTPLEFFETSASELKSCIRFTGVGDPDLYPVRDFNKSMQSVCKREDHRWLEYDSNWAGNLDLRISLCHILSGYGLQTNPENMLITSGSQQALSLICQTLLKPGDSIIVEKPTYDFALEFFGSLGVRILEVEMDHDGMKVDSLESLILRHRPKLIYTIPDFQNPTGVCMSGERRTRLIEISDKYDIHILEDDFVGELRYEGISQPTLKSLDKRGRVIYIGTFSKLLMPSLRIGYVVAEKPVYSIIKRAKRYHDICTSPLIQNAFSHYLTVGRYQSHLRMLCRVYRKRRDVAINALSDLIPDSITCVPQGGLFIWLKMPKGISSEKIYEKAYRRGVLFKPGALFYVDPQSGKSFIRLNFCVESPGLIQKGIRTLSDILLKDI